MTTHTLKIEKLVTGDTECRNHYTNFLVHYEEELMINAISVEKIHGFFLDKCYDGPGNDNSFTMKPFTNNEMWRVLRTGHAVTKDVV